jgi:hypothetical protein
MVWPDCDFLHGEWTRERKTSYWVRVPQAELERVLLHVRDADDLADDIARVAAGDEVHFLVSEDLDSIVPLPAAYPESGQWNGRSPFLPIEGWRVDDLDDLTRGQPPG